MERACWVRGYHVYKDVWDASIGEDSARSKFSCVQKFHGFNFCCLAPTSKRTKISENNVSCCV